MLDHSREKLKPKGLMLFFPTGTLGEHCSQGGPIVTRETVGELSSL